MKKVAVYWLFLVLLVGCATMPQSFGERLAYGYSLNTEVRNTAATALQVRRITVNDAERALEATDRARILLDRAADGNERGLDLAIEVLEVLNLFAINGDVAQLAQAERLLR